MDGQREGAWAGGALASKGLAWAPGSLPPPRARAQPPDRLLVYRAGTRRGLGPGESRASPARRGDDRDNARLDRTQGEKWSFKC